MGSFFSGEISLWGDAPKVVQTHLRLSCARSTNYRNQRCTRYNIVGGHARKSTNGSFQHQPDVDILICALNRSQKDLKRALETVKARDLHDLSNFRFIFLIDDSSYIFDYSILSKMAPTERLAPKVDVNNLTFAFPDGSTGLQKVALELPANSRTLLIGGM
jgi:hypothetical protein